MFVDAFSKINIVRRYHTSERELENVVATGNSRDPPTLFRHKCLTCGVYLSTNQQTVADYLLNDM